MLNRHVAVRMAGTLLLAAIITANLNVTWASDEPAPTKVDQTVLQSSVMSFADSMSAILLTAFEHYDRSKPAAENRNEVLSIVVYSLWNAYIIASESDPDIALLDMVSMVTLGRIIFEEQGIETFGDTVKPLVQGFRKAEKEILGIAILTLDHAQIERLRTLINRWREANPEVTFFPFIRFSNFSADRRESRLERTEEPDGLIDSVEAAAQQAEEMRLMAERGLYLGTRMPQLASLFAELWAAKLANDVTTERQNAIMQLVDVFRSERQAAIDAFMAGVTTERRNAVAQMGDILEAERQATVDDFMIREKLIIKDALAQMNHAAEALVDKTLIRITILVAIYLVGLTLANLLVGYILHRKSFDRQPVAPKSPEP